MRTSRHRHGDKPASGFDDDFCYLAVDPGRPTGKVEGMKTRIMILLLCGMLAAGCEKKESERSEREGSGGTAGEKAAALTGLEWVKGKPVTFEAGSIYVVEPLWGDANRSGDISVADVIYLINYLFKGGPAPNPTNIGDANCVDGITVSDPVYIINYLFKGGPEPDC